jgi:predicted enzyme related to lactoylglutathione lyase
MSVLYFVASGKAWLVGPVPTQQGPIVFAFEDLAAALKAVRASGGTVPLA